MAASVMRTATERSSWVRRQRQQVSTTAILLMTAIGKQSPIHFLKMTESCSMRARMERSRPKRRKKAGSLITLRMMKMEPNACCRPSPEGRR